MENTNSHIENIIKKIDKTIEKVFSIDSMEQLFPLPLLKDSLNTHFIIPSDDLIKRGGKRLRPLLLILLTQMLKGDEEKAYLFAPVIEGMHTASLIHDDIEDSSFKRRGMDSIHIKYGLDVALNAGSFLYFFSLSLIKLQKDEIKTLLYNASIKALNLLHAGQAMDIKHHSNYSLHFDYKMYELLASLKTASLFSLVAEVALILSNKELKQNKLPLLFNDIGIAFQMLDDIKNISSGNKGKDKGDDIVEGKLSFPIVLYLDRYKEKKEKIINFFKIAKEEGISSNAVNECCNLLEASGVIEEGFNIASEKISTNLNILYDEYQTVKSFNVIKSLFNSIM